MNKSLLALVAVGSLFAGGVLGAETVPTPYFPSGYIPSERPPNRHSSFGPFYGTVRSAMQGVNNSINRPRPMQVTPPSPTAPNYFPMPLGRPDNSVYPPPIQGRTWLDVLLGRPATTIVLPPAVPPPPINDPSLGPGRCPGCTPRGLNAEEKRLKDCMDSANDLNYCVSVYGGLTSVDRAVTCVGAGFNMDDCNRAAGNSGPRRCMGPGTCYPF